MPLSPLSMVCFECKRALSCRVMRWLLSHSPRINKKGGHIFFVKALCHSSIVAAASASKTQNITSAGKITASRPDETKGIAMCRGALHSVVRLCPGGRKRLQLSDCHLQISSVCSGALRGPAKAPGPGPEQALAAFPPHSTRQHSPDPAR